ncbi:hypothetical protein HOLleu_22068 [Holothuria leucospilota]|uniref:Uncharacterized protein n=1 Tax=Holothuria leucospilota TaxID=206669 RepID=A0A9Q1BX71_HOLLE|nr:hypothetical protein HOLleu_22068 [Holothuria leucospilota]
MCPGKKEFVSVKTAGGRVHMQKRLLLFNLGEVHRLFVAETNIDISRSNFCELRLKHIVPMSAGDQDVCLCRYHENINMMVTSLNKVVPLLPASADEVLNATVCSMENEECVNRQCPTCGTDNLDELFATSDIIPVTFYQWTNVDGRIQK